MNLTKNQTWPVTFRPSWNDIDSSKIQGYIECPRMFFYEHVLGWRKTAPNNHLVFGSAVHEALEHLYLHGFSGASMRDAYMKFLVYYRAEFSEHTDALFEPKTPDRFLQLLIEYVQMYQNDFDKYSVLYTEVTGRAPLTDEINIIFKIDAILRERSNGHYKTLEHKTKQGPFNNTWDAGWTLGIQAGTYTHALYCLYPPDQVDGVLINGLGMSKTKKYTFAFNRVPVYKTPAQMQIWHSSIMYWINRLQSDFAGLAETTESSNIMECFNLNPKSCTNWGRVCPYHDFCISWPNPIQRSHEPPIGFKIEFWEPLEEFNSTHHMDFTK